MTDSYTFQIMQNASGRIWGRGEGEANRWLDKWEISPINLHKSLTFTVLRYVKMPGRDMGEG